MLKDFTIQINVVLKDDIMKIKIIGDFFGKWIFIYKFSRH